MLKSFQLYTEVQASSRLHAQLGDTDFYQKVGELGEKNEKVWAAQRHLDHDIMIFLHRRCLHEGSIQQQDMSHAAYQAFGLICASGTYCQLAVQEVPQIVEWAIGEKDGLETVVIK